MPADFDAALRAHLRAIADRDLAAYAATVHQDAVLVLPGGQIHAGREAVVGFHAEMFADHSWTQCFEELERRQGQDHATVLLRSTYTEADEAGRQTLEARNLVGLTFVAAGGDWLLVHDQNTPERPAG
jgi:uncharacterized protein (TIGR02246 family)